MFYADRWERSSARCCCTNITELLSVIESRGACRDHVIADQHCDWLAADDVVSTVTRATLNSSIVH